MYFETRMQKKQKTYAPQKEETDNARILLKIQTAKVQLQKDLVYERKTTTTHRGKQVRPAKLAT